MPTYKQDRTQPSWVCHECGEKYKAGEWFQFSTWHKGNCGVCNTEKVVTEPRDCGYLRKGWHSLHPFTDTAPSSTPS